MCVRRQELSACTDALRRRPYGVGALQIQMGSREQLAVLKHGEEDKVKHYRAVCWAARPLSQADVAVLNAVAELQVQQDTPVRVLHRRAPLVRAKVRCCVLSA